MFAKLGRSCRQSLGIVNPANPSFFSNLSCVFLEADRVRLFVFVQTVSVFLLETKRENLVEEWPQIVMRTISGTSSNKSLPMEEDQSSTLTCTSINLKLEFNRSVDLFAFLAGGIQLTRTPICN